MARYLSVNVLWISSKPTQFSMTKAYSPYFCLHLSLGKFAGKFIPILIPDWTLNCACNTPFFKLSSGLIVWCYERRLFQFVRIICNTIFTPFTLSWSCKHFIWWCLWQFSIKIRSQQYLNKFLLYSHASVSFIVRSKMSMKPEI